MPVPRFWRMIPNRYNLEGTKCKNCETVFFPPRSLCPQCRRIGEIEPYQLKGEGKIISYTHIRAPQENFEGETPYTMAIIELEEGPRIAGQVIETNPNEVEVGDEVEVKFRKVGEESKKGIIHYGYKFQLAE